MRMAASSRELLRPADGPGTPLDPGPTTTGSVPLVGPASTAPDQADAPATTSAPSTTSAPATATTAPGDAWVRSGRPGTALEAPWPPLMSAPSVVTARKVVIGV